MNSSIFFIKRQNHDKKIVCSINFKNRKEQKKLILCKTAMNYIIMILPYSLTLSQHTKGKKN